MNGQRKGFFPQANEKVLMTKHMHTLRAKGTSNARIAELLHVDVSRVYRLIGAKGTEPVKQPALLRKGRRVIVTKGIHIHKDGKIVGVTKARELRTSIYHLDFGGYKDHVIATWCQI